MHFCPIAERNVSWKLMIYWCMGIKTAVATTTGCFVQVLTPRFVLIKYSVFVEVAEINHFQSVNSFEELLLLEHAINLAADCPAAYLGQHRVCWASQGAPPGTMKSSLRRLLRHCVFCREFIVTVCQLIL